jgi:hypothetical protein
MARFILPASALLALLAFAYSRDHVQPSDHASSSPPVTVDPGATYTSGVTPWDEQLVLAQAKAVLESFAGHDPDVHGAVELVNRVCASALPVGAEPTRSGDWLWWYVREIPGQRVKISFARGREDGIEASRVIISLMPSVSVPEPFRAWGSVIDVKAFMQDDRPQLIGVVTYAADLEHDSSKCHGSEDDSPVLTVGHRFRIDEAGATKLINYTARLFHREGNYVIQYNFGSRAFEYDYGAPASPVRIMAADAFAALERRVPTDA